MAAWMIHFRIADFFIKKYNCLNCTGFIVGNIALDCSIVDEHTGDYMPPFNITHFTATGRKLDMDIEGYFSRYISGKKPDDASFPFYLGYYIHLLTDLLWTKRIWLPAKEKYLNEFASVQELLNTVKKDWWAVDRIFSKKNPDFEVFQKFCGITNFDNNYLDFYVKDTFNKRIPQIRDVYKSFHGELKDRYAFFSETEADQFVIACGETIDQILEQHTILMQ